jgi:hypothetical protein
MVSGEGITFPEADPAAPVSAAAEAVAEPAEAVEPPTPVVQGGENPAEALTPTGEWMPLQVGEDIWFKFRYQGDGSKLSAWLDASPSKGAVFSVWTPEQIRMWSKGEDVAPVGRGSKDEYRSGDISWCGCFVDQGVYYVKVEHAGDIPAYFKLNVGGEDVWF